MKISALDFVTIEKIRKNDSLFAKLIKDNKKFLDKIIHKFIKHDDDYYDDFYQLSCMALHRALWEFNPNKNTSFSTFAWKVILNDLIQEKKKLTRIYENELDVDIHYQDSHNDSELSLINMTDFNNYISNYNDTTTQSLNKKNIEDEVISKVMRDNIMSNWTKNESAIIDMRLKNYSINEISKKLDINFHTTVMIYYKLIKKPEFREFAQCI